MDGALSTLVWWKGSLPMAGGWIRMIFKVSSNLNRSVFPFGSLRRSVRLRLERCVQF